jgi:predicted kinase
MVRSKQIKLFTQYHAAVRIVYLETGWAEQLRRNRDREARVPEPVICHMMKDLVLPEGKEAHRVEWYCI